MTMKKWLLIVSLIVSLFFIYGCQESDSLDIVKPYIEGIVEIDFTIGDETPDFLKDVIATDDIDGLITSLITVDTNNVVWDTPGRYPIIYRVKDTAGNEFEVTTYINITQVVDLDTEAPIITGLKDLNMFVGDSIPSYMDGISAFDNVDGNITQHIIVNDESVDYQTPGTYPIFFFITDASDNENMYTIYITVKIDQSQNDVELNIFYINDTHGAIERNGNQLGLASIASVVVDEKTKNPDSTLFIGGGDLLQGNILSNYYYGRSFIHMLNVMNMDAFVLGNHEYDWGLDIITRYRDPQSEHYFAQFPLLGANIFLKETMERPDFVDAYKIVQMGHIKVGIIGLMGYGLESSIAVSRVSDYVFDDPIIWGAYYAQVLRVDHEVDVVLAVIHDNNNYTNHNLASLTGNQQIDAIFNGHSHSRYTQTIMRNDMNVPVIQSKANGEFLGKVTLKVSPQKQVIEASAINLHPTSSNQLSSDRVTQDARLNVEHPDILEIINEYKLAISDLLNEVIIKSDQTYTQTSLTHYMAELIRARVNADIGIHNFGGTRAPLSINQNITVATLYQIFPFDNKIKYVYVTGRSIKDFANSSVSLQFRSGLSLSTLQDDLYYLVATNDYIFDQLNYPFISGVDPVDTGILIRDVLEYVLREQAKLYQSFRTDRPFDFSGITN